MQIEVPQSQCMRLITTRPLIVVTTLHENGVVNGGTFGSYCNLSGTELGIAIGKPSDTYQNIQRTGEFVVNVLSVRTMDASPACGESVPTTESEVENAGLTTAKSKVVAVPRIAECVASVECKYVKELPIGYHNFVVGEAQCGWCDEGMLDDQGYFDVVKAEVIHSVRYPYPEYAKFGEYIEGR